MRANRTIGLRITKLSGRQGGLKDRLTLAERKTSGTKRFITERKSSDRYSGFFPKNSYALEYPRTEPVELKALRRRFSFLRKSPNRRFFDIIKKLDREMADNLLSKNF